MNIIDATEIYFSFGAGFYTAAGLMNNKSFHHAGPDSIIRGFALGFILWPFAILTYPFWKRTFDKKETSDE